MTDNKNDPICDMRTEQIYKRLDTIDIRLDKYGVRLDSIEQLHGRFEERVMHLIDKINTLNTTMWWFIGLLVVQFVAFFFSVMKSGIIG